MNARIIVVILLPSIVQCFECTEELGILQLTLVRDKGTRDLIFRTLENLEEDYPNGYMILDEQETFVHNSTILCSHFNEITGDILQYQPVIYHDDKTDDYEEFLKIQDSNITTLPTSGFSKFSTITKLFLEKIHVRVILPEAFRNLTHLRELYLADNELTAASKGVFNSLHKLEVLDLSNNHIRTIEEFAFTGLDNLNKLLLARNQLNEINVVFFEGVKTLPILDVSQNSIERVSIDDMTIMTLNLSSNHFQTVDFRKFPKCDNVDLSLNRIAHMDNWEHIEISALNLSSNNLKYLNGTVNYVKILTFSHNEIETLILNFNSSTDLLNINLASNQISSLEENIFKGLRSLESLDLSHNNLSVIQHNLLHDLGNLTFLNISHNRIENFQFGTFNGPRRLTSLDISHNRLLNLAYYTFIPMSDLSFLYFEGNQIRSLDARDLTIHFSRLEIISLADNLWRCEDLASISHHFKQNKITMLGGNRFDVANLYGVACDSQSSDGTVDQLAEKFLQEVNFKVNTSLDDSSFVRFFDSGYKKTNFFQYFDNFQKKKCLTEVNLKVNVSLNDSDFVTFFNSSYRRTNFFQYFDNLLKSDISKEYSANIEKLISVQRPPANDGLLIVSLLVQILIALSLFAMIYLLFVKKFRWGLKQVNLTQESLL